MAIGKRIRFFRNRKGMTQKQLGEILGFLGKTSDVRMAQYESEARTPKQDLVKEMAHILDVSPRAITVPEIDSYIVEEFKEPAAEEEKAEGAVGAGYRH